MDVLIRLERDDPPAGTVVPVWHARPDEDDPMDARPFVGWLGLLRALAEMLSHGHEPTPG